MAFLGTLSGYKTYAVGFVLLINMIYMVVTGEQVPTYDNPGAAGGAEVVGGGVGAGLMTIRAAISKLSARLDAVIPKKG